MIKEVIIVEGRDDEQIVKRALECDVIMTHGYSYGKKFKEKLTSISQSRGIIIFTDPDYVGKRIRKDLSESIPNAKHAFLPRGKALKGDNIGVENATVEDVRAAIEAAKPEYEEYKEIYTNSDMIKYGLIGEPDSKQKRMKLAAILKIDYGNSKNFLKSLNSFRIDREKLERALEEIK